MTALHTEKSKSKHLSSVIRPQILASIALKNLLAKKLRTFLTIGGIVIGVGAIVFLVSLANGLHGVVNQQVIGSQSVKTIDVTSPNSALIHLNNDNLNKMTQFAHVAEVASAYILPGKISEQGSLTDAVIYGVDNNYIKLSSLKNVTGKSYLPNGKDAIISQSLLSLIGQSSAQKALNRTLSVQATLTLANGSTKQFQTSLKIVGVTNIGTGVAVYMNKDSLGLAGEAEYGQAKVVADNRNNVATIRSQIAGLGMTTASPLDTLSEINNIFTIFTFVVIGFGGIGMVIAILGMFNTLTISLLERTSEIGLMIRCEKS
jgi:putative ABC transport system permease protein